MKRVVNIALLLCCICICLSAQNVEHENILKIKYGWVRQADPYLSPLVFKGNQIGIANEWWQPFSKTDKEGYPIHWSHVGSIDIHGQRTYNSAMTNLVYGLGFNGGWGAYYRWDWFATRLLVILGPYVEADLMVREIGTNVNKPYSLDLGIDAMAMAGIQWSFYGTKTSYRLRYRMRANLIGFDYLPDYWQAYYEIAEGVSGVPRCSGPWNHNTVRHELSLDMQFPHSTWRIGAEHYFLAYRTSDMQFMRNQFNIILACIWNYRITPNKTL